MAPLLMPFTQDNNSSTRFLLSARLFWNNIAAFTREVEPYQRFHS